MTNKYIVDLKEETLSKRNNTKYEDPKGNSLIKNMEKFVFSIPIWKKIFKAKNESLVINRQKLNFENLPRSFNGYKILFISDLHLDIEPNPLNRFLKMKIDDYDIAVLGGDYFDNHEKFDIENLRYIVSKLGKPVYAVLGNHDNYRHIDKLESIGIEVLLNQAIKIEKNGESIALLGIDETVNNENGLQLESMKNLKEKYNGFSMLVSHSPDVLEIASGLKFDLQISGHTHGGQFLLMNKVIYKNTIYDKALSGIWSDKGMQGFTSTGFGNSGCPIRNITPEIVLIELTL